MRTREAQFVRKLLLIVQCHGQQNLPFEVGPYWMRRSLPRRSQPQSQKSATKKHTPVRRPILLKYSCTGENVQGTPGRRFTSRYSPPCRLAVAYELGLQTSTAVL